MLFFLEDFFNVYLNQKTSYLTHPEVEKKFWKLQAC